MDIDKFTMFLEAYKKGLVFESFMLHGAGTPQDCIHGILQLFEKSENIMLKHIRCSSGTIFQFKKSTTNLRRIELDQCNLMHPDLEPEERILPKEKFLSLKSLYYAQLFDL